VSVPADVFLTLTRTGTIKDSDVIGEQTYILADGSKSKSITFTIRSLRIGDTIVKKCQRQRRDRSRHAVAWPIVSWTLQILVC
jgi:hypothetical protein